MLAHLTLRDPALKALFGYLNKLQPIRADTADRNRNRCVAHKTVERGPNVYRKNITFTKRVVRGKTMHHLFIDRGADGKRKAVIAFEGRIGAAVTNHFVGCVVDL